MQRMGKKWALDHGQPLGAVLGAWKSQAASGRKPKTVKYNNRLVEIIRDRWPGDLNVPAKDVAPGTVVAFMDTVSHFSASLFNHIVNVLRVAVPAASFLVRRRENPKHVALPDQEEFQALLAEADKAQRSRCGLMVRFLVLSGMRIAEASKVEWRDVSDRGIYVRPEITKNGRPRSIPLIGEMPSVLARLKAISTGPRVLPQLECKRSLASACERAKLPRLTHHDLRRMFATRCIESGVDLPTAARWLGHSDGGALLAKTYFHLQDVHSREMAGRVQIAA